MGGYGSGRPASHLTCEASLRLDLSDPSIRTALAPGKATTGSWRWSSAGRQIASIGYTWSGPTARLILTYNWREEPVQQTIPLAASEPKFGGRRYWFVCPFTARWVRAVYLPNGAKLWGSRHAYRLRYQSQRETDLGKAMLRLLLRYGSTGADASLATAIDAHDPLGFREERRCEKLEEARARRNHMRRLMRRERSATRSAQAPS